MRLFSIFEDENPKVKTLFSNSVLTIYIPNSIEQIESLADATNWSKYARVNPSAGQVYVIFHKSYGRLKKFLLQVETNKIINYKSQPLFLNAPFNSRDLIQLSKDSTYKQFIMYLIKKHYKLDGNIAHA